MPEPALGIGRLRNASKVGPLRPSGSSGGTKRPLTHEYMSNVSSTTRRKEVDSVDKSRKLSLLTTTPPDRTASFKIYLKERDHKYNRQLYAIAVT